MTIDANPVLALAFTPDGAFIAGATRDKILIWKIGEYTLPRAQWSRTNQPGGRLSPKTNGTNGTAEVEDQHCLCWDASGQRLAFGVNDLVGATVLLPVTTCPVHLHVVALFLLCYYSAFELCLHVIVVADRLWTFANVLSSP